MWKKHLACVLAVICFVGTVASATSAQAEDLEPINSGGTFAGGWSMGPSTVSIDVYGTTDIASINVYVRFRTEEVEENRLQACNWRLDANLLNCTLTGLPVGDHYITVAQTSATGTWNRLFSDTSPDTRPVSYRYRVTADGSTCCIAFGEEPQHEPVTDLEAIQTGPSTVEVTWSAPPGETRPLGYLIVANGYQGLCWTTGLSCTLASVTDFGQNVLVHPSGGLGTVNTSADVVPLPKLASAASLEDIVRSTDYDPDVHADVLRLYWAFFDRQADVGGARYWIGVRDTHSLTAISQFFTASEEFELSYDGLDDGEFLGAVYDNVLGRNFDQAGFNYWLDLVQGTNRSNTNAGLHQISRGEAVRWIAASAELRSRFPYRP